MKSIDDDTVRFWLRRHERIKEWAALEAGAKALMNTFLLSLADDFQVLADELGEHVSVYVQSIGAYPRVVLFHPAWAGAPGEAPQAGIGLSWEKAKVNFAGGKPAFIGLWTRNYNEEALALERSVATTIAAVRKVEGYQSDSGWPAWNPVSPPNSDYAEDLDPFRTLIVQDTRRAYDLFAGLVDEAGRGLLAPEADGEGTPGQPQG